MNPFEVANTTFQNAANYQAGAWTNGFNATVQAAQSAWDSFWAGAAHDWSVWVDAFNTVVAAFH